MRVVWRLAVKRVLEVPIESDEARITNNSASPIKGEVGMDRLVTPNLEEGFLSRTPLFLNRPEMPLSERWDVYPHLSSEMQET
jgi:hypothetical protein